MNKIHKTGRTWQTPFGAPMLAILITLFTWGSANAQVAPYGFASTSGTYTPITGGTIVVAGAATPASDDVNYATQAIGFPFIFSGTSYTTFGVNSNGYIWFGTGSPLATNTTPISNASANLGGTGAIDGVVSALGRNILKRIATPFGELRVETIGAVGSRQCVIQFANWRGFGLGTTGIYNFQIRLSETSNTVSVVYGTFTTAGAIVASDFQIGLRGVDNNDFNNRSILATDTWATSTAGTANTAAATISATLSPTSGQTYTWTPAPPCSGIPTAGVASPANLAVCRSTIITLAGVTAATGLIYLWESSTTSATTGFSPIPTATTSSYVAPIPTVTTYYRCVVTCVNGGASANSSVTTLTVFSGITTFPYNENFDATPGIPTNPYTPLPTNAPTNGALPCSWTVDNVNGDGSTWYNFGPLATPTVSTVPNALIYRYNADAVTAANDWVFTSPLTLTAGNSYTVSFKARASDAPTFVEAMEVRWGTAATVAAMLPANIIYDNTNINSTTFATFTATVIVPSTTGVYYVGLYAKSIPDRGLLYIDDFQITEIVAAPTCSVLTNGTNAVPVGTVGSAYTFSGAVTSLPTTTAITYTISPALTNGLVLNPTTGEISSAAITGTANTTAYVISALQTTPSTCTAVTRNISIVIDAAPTCSVLTNGTNAVPVGTVGSAYTFSGAVTSLPTTTAITYTISPALTNGLVLNPTTGEISSAAITGTANTTAYVISALQTTPSTCVAVTRNISIVIDAVPTTCSVLTNGTNTVPVGTVGSAYTFSGAVTSLPTTTAITYTISPALTNGLVLNPTTGEISSATITGTANTTAYVISALQTTPSTCVAVTRNISIVISAAVPTCSVLTNGTNTVPVGTVGSAYTFSGAVTSAPVTTAITYTISPALTNGLVLNPTTGEISSATITGTANTTAYVISALQTTPSTCVAVTRNISIVIDAAATCPATVIFTPATLPGATVGVAYNSGAITATNLTGTVTYSSTTLPAGFAINSVTGAITAPATAITAATTLNGIIVVANTITPLVCTGSSAPYSIVVTAAPLCPTLPTLTLTPAVASAGALVSGTVGVPFSQTFTAGGIAGATYTYALTSGVVLPVGLIFTPSATSATISGNPLAATSVTVVVRATSNGGCVSPATSYTLVINPSPTTAIDNTLANLVKVSPNPSKGDFNVDFGTINMTKSSVRVYDAQGKVVFTSENNPNLMTISLDKFANGIYLMEAETSKGRILKRLAKQ